MRPVAALAGGIACAVLAVAVVAADLALNLEATLERMEGGSWTVVDRVPHARTEARYEGPNCSGNRFLLTVHNGLPWATSVRVAVTVDGRVPAGWSPQTLDLDPGETYRNEFTVPESMLARGGPEGKPAAHLAVQVGDHHMSACVGEAA
jgi:hypothetical protein